MPEYIKKNANCKEWKIYRKIIYIWTEQNKTKFSSMVYRALNYELKLEEI